MVAAEIASIVRSTETILVMMHGAESARVVAWLLVLVASTVIVLDLLILSVTPFLRMMHAIVVALRNNMARSDS